ncbi:MAG: hypothetical protein ACLQVD_00140 [Capsulimonadaceae bacterium]
MHKQVDVDVEDVWPVETGHEARVRWQVCDGGITDCEGIARYTARTSEVVWEQDAPPREVFSEVVFEIDRAVRRRLARLRNSS